MISLDASSEKRSWFSNDSLINIGASNRTFYRNLLSNYFPIVPIMLSICDMLYWKLKLNAEKFLSFTNSFCLQQLCPTRGPRAACGPVEGFVRPSLGFHCNRSNYILTTCHYFDNL